jgi:Tfp pilus assembly protein PilF
MSRRLRLLLVAVALIALAGCAANGRRSMERGKQYMDQKDYKRALIEYRNAFRHFPKDPEVIYQMALAYLANGDVNSGVASLRLATQIDPKHVNAQLKLSELMALNSREDIVQEAEKRAQAALAVDSSNAEAIATLAFAELRLGQTDVAEKRLEEAIAASPQILKPSLVLANLKLSQNDIPAAEAILKTAQKANPKSWEAWFALERFYMLINKVPEAEAAASQVLTMDPQNEASLLDLAAIKMALNKPAEADELYKKIAAHPSNKYQSAHALFLFGQGKPAEGISELEKLRAANKSDRRIRNQLVAAYLTAKRGSDAEKVLDAAIKDNPRDSDALLQRSEIRLIQGKTEGVEGDLAEVLKFKPDSGEAHYLMARLYMTQNSGGNEDRELYEALKLNPALLMARVDLARRMISRKSAKAALELLDAAPANQRKLLPVIAQRNWALIALGKNEEFRAGIDAGYQLGRTPDLLLQDALLHFRSKQFEPGRALLREALQKNPEDIRILQTLAESYIIENKDVNKALAELQKQVEEHPKSARIKHLYGNWLASAGKPGESRAAFESARAADPKYLGASLALAQIDLAQGQYDQARHDLEAVLKAQPNDPSSTLLMAMIDEKDGRLEPSIESYRKVLKMEPDNGVALNNLAYQLTKVPKAADEALQYAQKAKSLVPGNPAFDDTLGWAYYQKNLFPSAVKQLEIATAGPSPSPVRLYHLAMAYQKAGNAAKAKLAYERAHKIAPAIPEAGLARNVVGMQ